MMYNPVSTYRIQFNKDFTTKDLEKQLAYLSLLGVGTIYASPIFKATPGSAHGYDILTPLVFNPEITDMETFKLLGDLMHGKKMGWLQDIVPNHMGMHSGNLWLMDVLEKGMDSDYHIVFDLEPGVPSKENKMIIPMLGQSLDEALENKSIKLCWGKGNFSISYFDNVFPVNFQTFRYILLNEMVDAPESFAEHWKQYILQNKTPDKKFLDTTWEESKIRLQELQKREKELTRFLDNILITFNGNEHLMREVLQMQTYELCHWLESEKRMNYRRFFTVNGLICLRMEEQPVFEKYHVLVDQMVQQGYFQGLRIDHIDGLKDPNVYLQRLRKLVGPDAYIVAEKILDYEEEMPDFWPIQGNTGYDFLATVNNLFTSVRNYNKLRGIYKEVTHITDHPLELIYRNKKMILTTRMHGEWDNLVGYFNQLELVDYQKEAISPEEIKEAIGEFMLACPVYRLYPRQFPLKDQNRVAVQEIFEIAYQRNPAFKNGLDKLAAVLLAKGAAYKKYEGKPELFFSRLMQFTGPLMAKGVEDTSMYQYNVFIAHNEVGDAINARGISTGEYHRQMKYRLKHWPLTMSTTSTHDTKRGEDVRARLNVISVLTDEWEQLVHQWMQMNQKLKIRLEQGLLEPSHSVEYFVYQTLLGTFPFDGQADETYLERIDQYLVKALREAKRKVSWRDPDETYEDTVCEFTRKMLDPEHDFLESFVPFQQKVAWRGVVNSLAQLTLKCTSPGIPDIYQGTELWDLTLVDPDNRQPVDYQARISMLEKLLEQHRIDPQNLVRELMKNPFDGRVKLWLTHVLLNERRNNPELFSRGDYLPLEVSGALHDNVIAYARILEDQWFITMVPVMTEDLAPKSKRAFLQEIKWGDTRLPLPREAPRSWVNILTGMPIGSEGGISVAGIFKDAAVGLLRKG